MKILVTGGAGFIGSNLCEKLVSLNHEVIAFDCMDNIYSNEAKYENIEDVRNGFHKNYKFCRSNINGKRDIDLLNFDTVVHLAAKPGVRWSFDNTAEAVYWNTYASTEFMDYCFRTRRIKNFIFISSSTVYGKKTTPFVEKDETIPQSPYGLTKLHSEEYLKMFCKQFGVKGISLRLFSVYGPRQRPDLIGFKLINSILNKKQVEIFGDGSQERDFTYVDDIVDGIIKSVEYIEKQPEGSYDVFNLGRGDKVKLNHVIDLVEKEFKTECNKVYVSKNDIDLEMTWCNNEKARMLLNWEPKVNVEEGIHEMTEWFRDNREWIKKSFAK